jgi:hypothetical protein
VGRSLVKYPPVSFVGLLGRHQFSAATHGFLYRCRERRLISGISLDDPVGAICAVVAVLKEVGASSTALLTGLFAHLSVSFVGFWPWPGGGARLEPL